MAKALCTGHSGIIIGYIIITIYEVFYKIERVSECLLAPRYTRFIAFTSKNDIRHNVSTNNSAAWLAYTISSTSVSLNNALAEEWQIQGDPPVRSPRNVFSN